VPLQAWQAVITPAYNLPAQFVIHAVAPIYIDGTKQEEDKLSSTYISICRLIRSHSITSISIPSIATGIYQFPISLASKIAIAIATLKKIWILNATLRLFVLMTTNFTPINPPSSADIQ